MIKWILALLLLLSTTILADDYIYEYDFDARQQFLQWYPIISIHTKPYWYTIYKDESKYNFNHDVGGGFQIGLRYEFENELGYLEFKHEYATLSINDYMISFADEEPILIFEFRRYY